MPDIYAYIYAYFTYMPTDVVGMFNLSITQQTLVAIVSFNNGF